MPPFPDPFATLAGGLGLLLLGLSLATEGLQGAFGARLATWLARASRTPARAFAASLLATAALQSPTLPSAAAHLGLARRGWPLRRAAAAWMGLLPGTATIALLLAAACVAVDLAVAAPVLVAVGALLRLMGPDRRHGAVGESLAGIGLVLAGLWLLEQGFAGARLAPVSTASAVFAQFVFGVLLALVLPPAGAAPAVALAAVQGGLLTGTGGAVVVAGLSGGAVLTALLNGVGAGAPARRAAVLSALAHGVAAVLALALAAAVPAQAGPLAVAVVLAVTAALGAVAVTLALPRLLDALQARIPAPAEPEQAGDAAWLAAPAVAVAALGDAVDALTAATRRVARAALDGGSTGVDADRTFAEALDAASDRCADGLHRRRMDPDTARLFGRHRRRQQDQRASLRRASAAAVLAPEVRAGAEAAGASDFDARARRLLDALDAGRDPAVIAERLDDCRAAAEAMRLGVLTAAAAAAVPVERMEATLRWLATLQAALELQALAGRRPASPAQEAPRTVPEPWTEAGETLPQP